MGVNRQDPERRDENITINEDVQLGTRPDQSTHDPGAQTDTTLLEDSYGFTITNNETGESQRFTAIGESDAPTKGPDPAVWGDDEDRPKPGSETRPGSGGLEIGQIVEDEDGNVTKGPGEAWRQNDEGEYINR